MILAQCLGLPASLRFEGEEYVCSQGLEKIPGYALLQCPYLFQPFVPTSNAASTRSINQVSGRAKRQVRSVAPVPFGTSRLEQRNGTGTRASPVPKMLSWNSICTYLGSKRNITDRLEDLLVPSWSFGPEPLPWLFQVAAYVRASLRRAGRYRYPPRSGDSRRAACSSGDRRYSLCTNAQQCGAS